MSWFSQSVQNYKILNRDKSYLPTIINDPWSILLPLQKAKLLAKNFVWNSTLDAQGHPLTEQSWLKNKRNRIKLIFSGFQK